ncbi:potential copper-zinc superoxide dismutase, CuZn SOD1 [Chondrus crispus]|uniref:Potential copper-zinc superoxide dismutase, CuZn SOD1 n=1 Tax=Chondrus crispus TaxID=2769 RepID=R7QQ00_CHOCR|nr:potential copper-zinc superoxide dismutase, CuZn SOD1 [Chondrus crispus]CDF40562.1 potential copper-zinc superoxide dismutase, CuZn SOD1 [Chondrus crispus]|eukprot:XP_005710856.1 potential copper-zinc superoxide dismutase, CuZn SOD1 [Chondrus crispus]
MTPLLVAALLAAVSLAAAAEVPLFTQEGCSNLPTLVCTVQPTDGYSVEGVVYFTPAWRRRGVGEQPDLFTCYVRIMAAVAGLTNPQHGFHVHTYGDVSVSDGSSTGGHFTNVAGDEIEHGLPDDEIRHWGDLGNLINDGKGNAEYDRVDKVVRLGALVGRGITIHEDQDAGSSEQPTGASGTRIGFCVIGYANPEVIASASR